MFPIAIVKCRKSAVLDRLLRDWASLPGHVSVCKVGQKDVTGWLPADIEIGPRLAARGKSVSLLVLDVEAASRMVEGEKSAIGILRASMEAWLIAQTQSVQVAQ